MDFEAKYGRKFKIFVDDAYKAETMPSKTQEKWRYLELRGKYGYAYPHNVSQIAIAVTGSKIAAKVRRQHTWKVLQDADDATVFLIPDTDTQVALQVLKLFRKKVLSDEDKAKKAAVLEKARAVRKAIKNDA
jgi:hypothetical protein